jgi:hypothetical protein
VKNLFESEKIRSSIFSPTSSWGDSALRAITGMGPKYSAQAKLPAIQALTPTFGKKTLKEAAAGIKRTGAKEELRLLVVGFDYDRNRAVFFRSVENNSPGWGNGAVEKVAVAEAIHASTNAPVNYFDAPATLLDPPNRYWDGGITGLNNPLVAAVVEAVTAGQNPRDIVALSLGTGTVALPLAEPGEPQSVFTRPRVDQSLVQDLRKLATSVLDDPPDTATFIAHVMTGGLDGAPPATISRVVRMSPLISPVGVPGHWNAPKGVSPDQFQFLVDLDMDAVQPGQVAAISSFAGLWLADGTPNQPIRMDCDTLCCEIGYASYGEAEAAWRILQKNSETT